MENIPSAKKKKKMEILLCADISTARHQHGVEACMSTVCCISGAVETNDKTPTNVAALN